MVGIALLTALSLVALVVAFRRGFSGVRLVVCLGGALVGGATCGLLSGLVVLMMIDEALTGPGRVPQWPAILFGGSSAAGALTGLVTMDHLMSHAWPAAMAFGSALAGFVIGVGCTFAALLLVQKTPGEQAFLGVGTLTIAATTVAGYSLQARRA
jgi:hypothetical protein